MKSIAFSSLIAVLLLSACQKEKNLRDQRLLPPSLVAYRTTDQAVIKIYAINGDDVWRPFDYVAPDRFKIYRSVGDLNDFKQIEHIPNDETYTYTATELEAGTPYYFYVKSEKIGLESVVSDTIMLVPSEVEQPVRLTNPQSFPIQSATISPDGERFAYTDPTYTWDNGMYGATSLFIYDLLAQTSSLVQRSAVFPDWSADGGKLAFCTDLNEVAIEQGYIPQHLSLLDVPSGNITPLTSGAEFVVNPDISPDGEWIAFASDEGHRGEFEIWKIRIDGSDKTELTNGLGHSVTAASSGVGKPCWSPDGTHIYFGVSANDPLQDGIFKLALADNSIEPVLQSQWQELNPVPSPDERRMAFFSDRSGLIEIWLMDLQNGKLRQLTGTENNAVEDTWGKLEWLDDDTLLYIAYPNDGSAKQAYFKLDIP